MKTRLAPLGAAFGLGRDQPKRTSCFKCRSDGARSESGSPPEPGRLDRTATVLGQREALFRNNHTRNRLPFHLLHTERYRKNESNQGPLPQLTFNRYRSAV